jgi:hypothetical protein
MMKGCLTTIGLFLGAVFLVVCFVIWLNFGVVEVHCRITIDVQDGDQIKTGSGVIGILYTIQPDWSVDHFRNDTDQRGYAPTVDLGDKGLLALTFTYATRTPAQQAENNKYVRCFLGDIGCLPFAAYHLGSGGNMEDEKVALGKLRQQSGPRDLPFVVLPLLVRIADGDRLPVAVHPDDLAAQFGQGVALRRVTLELTNDAVTPQPALWPKQITENHELIGTLWGGYK